MWRQWKWVWTISCLHTCPPSPKEMRALSCYNERALLEGDDSVVDNCFPFPMLDAPGNVCRSGQLFWLQDFSWGHFWCHEACWRNYCKTCVNSPNFNVDLVKKTIAEGILCANPYLSKAENWIAFLGVYIMIRYTSLFRNGLNMQNSKA